MRDSGTGTFDEFSAPTSRLMTCTVGRPEGDAELSLEIAEETAVAFRYGGFPHAVMMASPADLTDFALGFSLSEGIINVASDVVDLIIRAEDEAIALEAALSPACMHRYLSRRRVRQLRGHTGCGICGKEDLTDFQPVVPRLRPSAPMDGHAVALAGEALRHVQDLSRRTHAAHAAAWVETNGTIVAVREDVGRHNALDKLIGAAMRRGFSTARGFCLITSRCSFEMAQKAAAAGFSTLVSMSAPTVLAIGTAKAAGLTLLCFRKDGSLARFSDGSTSREVIGDGKAAA